MKSKVGWIFGFYSKQTISDEKRKKIESFLPSDYVKSNSAHILISFSKSINTYFNHDKKWLVNGVGISSSSSTYSWIQHKEWSEYQDGINTFKATGHFLKINWTDTSVTIQSDVVGLKTVYLLKKGTEIYFSTSLEMIVNFVENPKLDLAAFGSKWLLYNQLIGRSIFKDIFKLSPNSKVTIENGAYKVNENVWLPEFKNYSTETFWNDLHNLLDINIPKNYKLSLGLSGGLDSRIILALLQKSKKEFFVHTFGYEYEPDVQIARKICSALNIKHHLLLSDFKDKEFAELLPSYLSENELVEPASTFLRLYKLNDNYFSNKIMIDGANGEVYRRQFLNRLYYTGKKIILNKDIDKIFSVLKYFRAEMFTVEITEQIKKGCNQEIEEHLDTMPSPIDFGFENYLDWMNIKTRFVNYFGPEQMRLDSFLPSYMPYINEVLLSNVFSIPLNQKKNGKMFIDFMKSENKLFSSIPLVKGNTTYPFGLSKSSAFIYTYMKNKLKFNDYPNPIIRYYNSAGDEVKQVMYDVSTKNSGYYDWTKVHKVVNGFYSGDQSYVSQLDWLYSFELFRRGYGLTS